MNKLEKIPLSKDIKILLLQLLKAGEVTHKQGEELCTYFVDNELINRDLQLSDEQFKQALEAIKPKIN
jgi:hypothetical protein